MASRGQFVWEELMTTDTASAAAFYAKVAGLKTQPAPNDASYTLLVASAGRMGGMMALADAKITNASPRWLSYISTLNVDETARQAELLGGKIVKSPAVMGDGGRFAILQDPQGALFAVYTPPQASSTPPAVSLGGMSWHELATTDINAALSFYQQLFGWTHTSDMDMGAQGIYRMFAPEGSKDAFGGMYVKPPQQPGAPAWLPYIKVADGKRATATAKSLGAQILHGPADVPGGGLITMAVDPKGVAFALHQAGPAAAPKAKSKPKPKSKAQAAKKKAAPKQKSAKKKPAKKKPAKNAKRKAGSKK